MSIYAAKTKIRKLDEDIAHLNEQLRRLKTQRNALTPIGHLPDEVLVDIFRCYHRESQRSYFVGQRDVVKELRRIIHTCSLWRAVSTQSASSWPKILTSHTSSKILKWFLERGESQSIRLAGNGDYDPNVLALLLDHVHRIDGITFLTVADKRPSHLALFRAMARIDRLRLETFIVNTPDLTKVRAAVGQLLTTAAARLRTLDLSGLTLPWDTLPSFNHLHTLRLTRVNIEHDKLLDALSDLSSVALPLHTFFIADTHLQTTSLPQKKIRLPALKRFHCVLYLDSAAAILQALELPGDCRLEIECLGQAAYDPTAWASYCAGCLTALRRVLGGYGLQRIDTQEPSFAFKSIRVYVDYWRLAFTASDGLDPPTGFGVHKPSRLITNKDSREAMTRNKHDLHIELSSIPDVPLDHPGMDALQQLLHVALSNMESMTVVLSANDPQIKSINVALARTLPHLAGLHWLAFDSTRPSLPNEVAEDIIASLTPSPRATLGAPDLRTLTFMGALLSGNTPLPELLLRNLMLLRREQNATLRQLLLRNEAWGVRDLVETLEGVRDDM